METRLTFSRVSIRITRHGKRKADTVSVISWILVTTVPLNCVHCREDAISYAAKGASFGGATVKSVRANAGSDVVDFQSDVTVRVERISAKREEIGICENFCC